MCISGLAHYKIWLKNHVAPYKSIDEFIDAAENNDISKIK